MQKLLSIKIWVFGILLTILLYFVSLFFTIIFFFDEKRKLVHAQCYWWADSLIRLNPYWRLNVSGLENINPKKTYVVVANHQSMADIMVMYKTRMQFKWVSKEDVFKVPFVGWCLSLGKHIKLSRGSFGSVKKVYREATQWLRKDMSVVFFPEGTRSNSDEMNVFQNGAFKLAIKEKKPILPVSITGTREAIPKGGWVFKKKVNGKLTILPPIETQNFLPKDFKALRDLAFSKIKTAAY